MDGNELSYIMRRWHRYRSMPVSRTVVHRHDETRCRINKTCSPVEYTGKRVFPSESQLDSVIAFRLNCCCNSRHQTASDPYCTVSGVAERQDRKFPAIAHRVPLRHHGAISASNDAAGCWNRGLTLESCAVLSFR